jgi:hypothetical protein
MLTLGQALVVVEVVWTNLVMDMLRTVFEEQSPSLAVCRPGSRAEGKRASVKTFAVPAGPVTRCTMG